MITWTAVFVCFYCGIMKGVNDNFRIKIGALECKSDFAAFLFLFCRVVSVHVLYGCEFTLHRDVTGDGWRSGSRRLGWGERMFLFKYG